MSLEANGAQNRMDEVRFGVVNDGRHGELRRWQLKKFIIFISSSRSPAGGWWARWRGGFVASTLFNPGGRKAVKERKSEYGDCFRSFLSFGPQADERNEKKQCHTYTAQPFERSILFLVFGSFVELVHLLH